MLLLLLLTLLPKVPSHYRETCGLQSRRCWGSYVPAAPHPPFPVAAPVASVAAAAVAFAAAVVAAAPDFAAAGRSSAT